MSKFTIVNSDDWTGLYVDGKSVAQNHSIDLYDALQIARDHGPVDSVERIYVTDLKWLDNLPGHYPMDLSEVPGAI